MEDGNRINPDQVIKIREEAKNNKNLRNFIGGMNFSVVELALPLSLSRGKSRIQAYLDQMDLLLLDHFMNDTLTARDRVFQDGGDGELWRNLTKKVDNLHNERNKLKDRIEQNFSQNEDYSRETHYVNGAILYSIFRNKIDHSDLLLYLKYYEHIHRPILSDYMQTGIHLDEEEQEKRYGDYSI
jgi:hypothetical protein